jgi:hypothetical protein
MGSRGPVNGPSGLDQFLTGDQDHPGFGAIGGTPDRREDVSEFARPDFRLKCDLA